MPRLIGGPEKAHDADVTIAAHAMRVRTTMLSLASFSEFPTFTNYKIRITFLFYPKCCAGQRLAMAKLQIKYGNDPRFS